MKIGVNKEVADNLREKYTMDSQSIKLTMPVADNHYPDTVHGEARLFRRPMSPHNLYACIAVDIPPEEDNDPVAGMWWVLVGFWDLAKIVNKEESSMDMDHNQNYLFYFCDDYIAFENDRIEAI